MIYPWIEATGCCTLVLNDLDNVVSHWEQTGVARKATTVEEANLLIIGGWINQQQAENLKQVYSRMAPGKQVLVVGSCSLSGSVFSDLPDLFLAKEVVPVHFQVTGCPPRWDDVLKGISRLSQGDKGEKTVKEILNEVGSDNVF